MCHVAERNGDQRPGPDEQHNDERAPGSAIEPARLAQPTSPDQSARSTPPPQPPQPPQQPAPELDAEQLRQFQQFQQFQDFLRYNEAQQQSGGTLVPAAPQEPRRPKLPRWLRRLGGKILGWVIVLVLLLLAMNWAYDHYFGTDSDEDKPAAETGGGTYKTNDILSDLPHEAVRQVYDAIAQEDPRTGLPPVPQACGRFSAPTQQQFAENLGYADCQQAVLALHENVVDVNDYAESMSSSVSRPVTGETIRIDSCDFEITGGPALGVFTVTQVELGQWLITGHEQGPRRCPAPASTSR